MECSVSVLDTVAASGYLADSGKVVMRGSVRQEFASWVVAGLKNDLLDGVTLRGLVCDWGSCATMWTESAQKKLIADNQDTCFHPLDLGLEGAFSLARYQDRVRAAIVDAPIDALVASVRQYLADNCGVDPFLEEIEWTR